MRDRDFRGNDDRGSRGMRSSGSGGMGGGGGGDWNRRPTSPVNVGDEIEVTIEAVGAKGDGLAKKDGFVLFVPNAKAGQKYRVKITRVLRKVGFAEIVGENGAAPSSESTSEQTESSAESSEQPAETSETSSEESYDESADSENFGEDSDKESLDDEEEQQ